MPKIIKNGIEYTGSIGDIDQIQEDIGDMSQISDIGDGTCAGAISNISSDLEKLDTNVSNILNSVFKYVENYNANNAPVGSILFGHFTTNIPSGNSNYGALMTVGLPNATYKYQLFALQQWNNAVGIYHRTSTSATEWASWTKLH